MAITTAEKELLNKMNSTALKTQLGTLIQNAESGGLAAGAVGSTELAADAVTNAKLADDAVSLENLDAGLEMSHKIVAAGTFTTLGGDASESITAAAVLGTDVVQVSVKTAGGTPREVVAATAGAGSIAVTMSGDPSTDHVLQYVAVRAVS